MSARFYSVEGIRFTEYELAAAFAQYKADQYDRPVALMEKPDPYTLWHLLFTYMPLNNQE